MAARKKPEEDDLLVWCTDWDDATHAEKLQLCEVSDISYETGRHWRSDSADVVPVVLKTKKAATPYYPSNSSSTTSGTLTIDTRGGAKTGVVANDFHIPYEDKKAVESFLVFLQEHKPSYVFLNGDIGDWYMLSSFDKNPARLHTLQSDLDAAHDLLKTIRGILPKSMIFLLDGNHEDRLRRHLWSKDPQLSSLRCLELSNLYRLTGLDIVSVPYEEGLRVNDKLLILHGNIIGAHSGYTAKRMFEKHGGSGIHGHTHRGGTHLRRNRDGVFGWWENYCMCSLNPDWIKHPNWQQGFSMVHFVGSRFWVESVQIIEGKFVYGGKMYGT